MPQSKISDSLEHCTPMISTVTKSQSNRASLGHGGTGDSDHGCADDKYATTTCGYC